MCLQTIENKSMLMHSNHRLKPMLPSMKLKKEPTESVQSAAIYRTQKETKSYGNRWNLTKNCQ